MKPIVFVSVLLAVFSVNSWSQEIDYDKRNMHIFCASHLAVISDSLTEGGDQYKALMFMSGVHGDEAKKMGATEKHFTDVTGYLKKVRKNNKQKWSRLSSRSKEVCFPQS